MSVRLYIREAGKLETVREYGTDRHHSLKVQEDGSLQFYHLQNGDGTGESGGYEFCYKDGSPVDLTDYREDGIIDIGGDRTGVDCPFCTHRYNPDICALCCRNPDREDCYKEDKKAKEEWQEKILEAVRAHKEKTGKTETDGETLPAGGWE